jgi:diguanylate cyclase (GGDEF)-like protein
VRSNDDSPVTNVLVVDDDPAILSLMSHLLEQIHCKVRTAVDGNQALQMVLQDCPDMLITDSMMPYLDGLELTRRVRQLYSRKVLPHYLYILLMTGQSNKNILSEGLESGVDDFLEKSVASLSDFRIGLHTRINAARRMRQLEISLEFAAKYDFLTSLLNRISFFRSAGSLWENTGKSKSPISCVFCDCDFFKQINDVHGHSVGDVVLKEVAARMRNSSRATDLLCRYGGEEFVALLPGCNEQMAFEWAVRLRQQFEATPVVKDDLRIAVTVSFGVAARSNAEETLEHLIDRTDACLLQAKERGRNRVICASELLAEESVPSLVDSSHSIYELCSGVLAKEIAMPFDVKLRDSDDMETAINVAIKTKHTILPVYSQHGLFAGTVSVAKMLAVAGDALCWKKPIAGLISSNNVVSYPPNTPVHTVFNFICRTSPQIVLITDGQSDVSYITVLSLYEWLKSRGFANE